MAQPVSIAVDGDQIEQAAWARFAETRFPSYEQFWVRRVVPLTGRPTYIHFRSTTEIEADGFTDGDVAIAQLHYTLLKHLAHVQELLHNCAAFAQPDLLPNREFGEKELLESFVRLSGVSDIADELLGRFSKLDTYDPWSEADGQRARTQWRAEVRADALAPVRAYRNRLVHGRLVPHQTAKVADPVGVILGTVFLVPKLDTVDRHLDWREAVSPSVHHVHPDFAEAAIVARGAWEQAVDYTEAAWSKYLVPLT